MTYKCVICDGNLFLFNYFPLYVIFLVPNPVLNLVASPKSSTSVEVNWSYPQGTKQYYKYLVQTYNTTGALFTTTVSNNSTDVTNLEPGTRYNVNVTTIAATGSESTEEHTFSYTSKASYLYQNFKVSSIPKNT